MPLSSNHRYVKPAANISTVLFGFVIVFQILIVGGIIPISMAWGGQYSVLTNGLKVAGMVTVIILLFFAYVIRKRAGLFGKKPPSVTIKIVSWFITGFMAVNTLGNLASQRLGEKILFTPITIILFAACFMVSISKS